MQPLTCDLWLMEPNAFRQFAALAGSNMQFNAEEVRAAAPQSRRNKSVAVLPVHGPIEARYSFIGEMLGMTSAEKIGVQFDSLMQDETVSGIVLDIASPGGMVYGTPELANKIFQARGAKPILAVANPMAASGAFWIGAAADRFIVSPSGDVGSVGVIAEHVDISQHLEKEGAKVTTIRSTAAPFKAETTDAEPLTDDAKRNLQNRADRIHDQFAGDLARFRGVSVEHVNQHFGQGRIVDAHSAMKAGMVDRVDTLESTVVKLATGRIRLGNTAAQDYFDREWITEERMNRIKSLGKNASVN